jgi:hypothetical protein
LLCGKVADLLLCRGSIPVLTMLWWIYVFIVALPFVVLKNNGSRLLTKGENIRKLEARNSISEISLILLLENAHLWSPLLSSLLFKDKYFFGVRHTVPLLTCFVGLLPVAVDQLYFLLWESRKIPSLGEGLQKRPPAFVAAKMMLGVLCAIVLQLCL